MEVLKEYKKIFLAGAAVLLFFAAAAFVVGSAEEKASQYTYAEHIFREGIVNEIDIQIDEADWQDMLENPLEEAYHRVDVTINGETLRNVAIRTKGNTSLTSVASSDSDRYSFKLDFDYYEEGGNYYGLKKLCLNNHYADNSSMREYISYQIMGEMGIPVPACGYSHITINGEEWGLYLAVETVDEVFLQTRFADATGDLYKPEGMDGTGADLVYRGDDISAYTGLNLKTNQETSDGSEILALMQALETGDGLDKVLNIENVLKYIAANVALANFDSYLGDTTHNYYLYEENGVFSVIPWDMNLAFGGFGGGTVDIYEPTASGGHGGGRGEGNTERTAKLPVEGTADTKNRMAEPITEVGKEMPERGAGDKGFGGMSGGEKPLVTTILEKEELLALYEGYLQEIAENYLTEEYMAETVTQLHDLIAPYVEQDATAFYTYEEFEQACSTDAEDAYSLVYYAVNMAESIQNQLAGGEPTFDTSSLQGGGMGFGGKGGGMPDFGGETAKMEEMPDFGGETAKMGEMPDFGGETAKMGEMPDFGGEATKMGEMPDFGGEAAKMGEMPDFGGEAPEMGEMPEMGGRPSFGGQPEKQAEWKEILPVMAVCGGIFAAGAIFLRLFRRKKELKPPKEEK